MSLRLPARSDGSVYVAWNGFRNGADALMVARYQYAGGEFRALGSWEAVTGSILNPSLVAGGDGAWLVYSAERGRNWDIYALPVTAAGPGKPVAVTADAPRRRETRRGVAQRRAVGGVGIEPRGRAASVAGRGAERARRARGSGERGAVGLRPLYCD